VILSDTLDWTLVAAVRKKLFLCLSHYKAPLFFFQIGSDEISSTPNVAHSNTKDILLKGNIVDGVTEAQDLMDTPVATELTEDFVMYPNGIPATPAEFFYENELLRQKISELIALKSELIVY